MKGSEKWNSELEANIIKYDFDSLQIFHNLHQ
jgi:hypothetical protein